MFKRHPLFVLILIALLVLAPGLSSASDQEVMRVVYHINQGDPAHHIVAMRNVQNHINAVGIDNIDLKVVMHGGGINLLLEANDNPDIQAAVDNLKLQGVDFQVCRNTLTARNINADQLYDLTDADIVECGVAQLSILQMQGYTYIKP